MREKAVRLIRCERNAKHTKNYNAHSIVFCTELGLGRRLKRFIFLRGASSPAILTILVSSESVESTCFVLIVRWGDVWTARPERSCRLYKRSSSSTTEECFLFSAIMVSVSVRMVNCEQGAQVQGTVTPMVHVV